MVLGSGHGANAKELDIEMFWFITSSSQDSFSEVEDKSKILQVRSLFRLSWSNVIREGCWGDMTCAFLEIAVYEA